MFCVGDKWSLLWADIIGGRESVSKSLIDFTDIPAFAQKELYHRLYRMLWSNALLLLTSPV